MILDAIISNCILKKRITTPKNIDCVAIWFSIFTWQNISFDNSYIAVTVRPALLVPKPHCVTNLMYHHMLKFTSISNRKRGFTTDTTNITPTSVSRKECVTNNSIKYSHCVCFVCVLDEPLYAWVYFFFVSNHVLYPYLCVFLCKTVKQMNDTLWNRKSRKKSERVA